MVADPKSIARAYLEALERKDYKAMRQLVHDDLSFRGPMTEVKCADDFIRAVSMLESITDRVKIRKMIAEGGEVCALYDFVTTVPIGTARMAEWYAIDEGKIRAIELYFDPRPWTALSG